MNNFIITLIFIVVLVSGVYFYAGYLTRTGKAEDADGNFIPDSWEENFGWFFSSKGLIMFALGLLLGYVLGVQFPDVLTTAAHPALCFGRYHLAWTAVAGLQDNPEVGSNTFGHTRALWQDFLQ